MSDEPIKWYWNGRRSCLQNDNYYHDGNNWIQKPQQNQYVQNGQYFDIGSNIWQPLPFPVYPSDRAQDALSTQVSRPNPPHQGAASGPTPALPSSTGLTAPNRLTNQPSLATRSQIIPVGPSLDFLGIGGSLDLIFPESKEAPVQRLWNTVVGTWFPAIEGFSVATNSAHLDNENMPDIIVEHHVFVNVSFSATQILLVECKPPADGLKEHGWGDVIHGQFHDDLTANLNASKRMFGAVAIGKEVQFFKYDGRKSVHDSLKQITPRLHFVGDQKQIERGLNLVKAEGPQWSRS